jgi:hypothetical protein
MDWRKRAHSGSSATVAKTARVAAENAFRDARPVPFTA